ncbi:hypothetical protein RN001_006501 [Aquatica leii]|uniref:CWH43-like N-terminal domain-containing protein n=1 Tax=Aquatica leii TaxID=1421715 RepID=A0AAN7PDL6_9COLE|nr:hypothetical protein RN001_006501 [Aquatica leii]
MGLEGPKSNAVMEHSVVHIMLSFKRLCIITIACPVVAILVCLMTAVTFQADDVHETHCRVYNIIPSISAITGVSPQRYLWRISVALHIGPRFIIAAVYKAYHEKTINPTADLNVQNAARKWLNITFWLDIIEIASLCGVTYISNLENYPIHEKLFITFMISSLTHMLASIVATKKVADTSNKYENFKKTITIKSIIFIISIISTVGLVGFFLEHRYLCHDMAFSWFAFCEYVVASANMAFHITVIFDFPTEYLVVAKGLKDKHN